MNPVAAVLVLVLLVALTTALGLVWRRRQGRVSIAADSADTVTAAQLGLSAANLPRVFGSEATLLQFSTEFCARCPGTSTLLRQVADARTGVRHVDVDLTHRADLARRFNVLQTPTTLVLDRGGRVRARVGGVPDRAALQAHLDDLVRDVQESE
jgi:thiol-disulfide isomerase/thioredoxin